MTKKEKTENSIANLDRNARMASVYTEATAELQSSQNQIERDPGCQYSLAREEDPMYENSTYKRLQDMHKREDYYHASST